ncbi:MAG: hypothetical protein FWF97_03325 [Alphaproteobacteria bacterium]|nr:hypothetical protein [Alphaproteobacteria bacterium]
MPKKEKKLTLEQLIEKADAEKKANPLDLSSDQDLSIALMNLVSLEEHFFFSGAKTDKPGYYDLINTVREMRSELMKRIVNRDGHDGAEVWCISKHLLAASMRLKEVGDKANMAGKRSEARNLYGKAYDLYSLFWGINMGLIDLDGVKKIEGDILPYSSPFAEATGDRPPACGCTIPEPAAKGKAAAAPAPVAKAAERKSTVKLLGDWVRKAVNCCIE